MGRSTVSGVWIRRKILASIVERATKFAKLEEGERRGTLRKEAVGLGRDASPSSDEFFLPVEIPDKFQALRCRRLRDSVRHGCVRIMCCAPAT